jgi:hypothetical protein
MSHNKEIMENDIQHAVIYTQFDAINYILNSPFFKDQETLNLPANKVMQRSWLTFTEKDDPNQPSHRYLTVKKIKIKNNTINLLLFYF